MGLAVLPAMKSLYQSQQHPENERGLVQTDRKVKSIRKHKETSKAEKKGYAMNVTEAKTG